MALVAAKCTNCGANIEVDESKEAGICRYCGTAFITEKAINNYVTNVEVHNHVTQTTNITAGTVHIHEDQLNRFFVVEEGYLIKYKGKLKKVTVPDGIIGIAEDAFNAGENSAVVEEVILPASVVEIQDEAFGDFLGYAQTIVRIPENTQLQVVGKKGFGCNSYVVIPPSVLSIAKEAFSGEQVVCYHGSKREFVQKYGADALIYHDGIHGDYMENLLFENCKGVVEKQDGTKYAFSDTETLLIDYKIQDPKKYVLPTEIDGRKITNYGLRLIRRALRYETVVFPEGITALPDKIFTVCGDIKHLYLPKSLKYIGKDNFTYISKKNGVAVSGLHSIHFAEGTDLDEWVDIRFSVFYPYDPPKVKGVQRPKNYQEITVIVEEKVEKSVSIHSWAYSLEVGCQVRSRIAGTESIEPGHTLTQRVPLGTKYICFDRGSGIYKELSYKSPLTVRVKKRLFGYKIIQE